MLMPRPSIQAHPENNDTVYCRIFGDLVKRVSSRRVELERASIGGDNSPTYRLCQENNGGKKTEHHDDHTIQFAVSVGRDRDSKECDHRPTTTTIHLYISTYIWIFFGSRGCIREEIMQLKPHGVAQRLHINRASILRLWVHARHTGTADTPEKPVWVGGTDAPIPPFGMSIEVIMCITNAPNNTQKGYLLGAPTLGSG